MITIKEAVIVEGKYDKMRLKNAVNTLIIETNGFRIFKDKAKVELIKEVAEKQGIVILTDSDGAGFVIRNHLKGIIPENKIKNAYVPQIVGKEKRKAVPSKEGFLGVEGFAEEEIITALQNAGVTFADENQKITDKPITRTDLFNLKLTGSDNSKIRREKLLKRLNLPHYITTKALLEILNATHTLTELEEMLTFVKEEL